MNTKIILFLIAVIFIVSWTPKSSWAERKYLVIEINAAFLLPSVDLDFNLGSISNGFNGLNVHAGISIINPIIKGKEAFNYISGNFGLRRFLGKTGSDGAFWGFQYILGKFPSIGSYEGILMEGGIRTIFKNEMTLTLSINFGAMRP